MYFIVSLSSFRHNFLVIFRNTNIQLIIQVDPSQDPVNYHRILSESLEPELVYECITGCKHKYQNLIEMDSSN